MKILVTGATGFVGSHVLEALSAYKQFKVVAASRRIMDPKLISDADVFIGDLRNKNYVEKILDGVDVICHCASWSSLYGHKNTSRKLYLEPTLNLLRLAKEKGIKKFINISTTSAASPESSKDAMSEGIKRQYWPHLNNIIQIEDEMKRLAKAGNISMINLRLGIFAGKRYGLGILPILLPRLKTHLVPYVNGGKTSLPIIDGRDIGQAFYRAVQNDNVKGYQSFNIVGPEIPSVKEVISYIHQKYLYPAPHFSVPFPIAYLFAWMMEAINPLVPWEPLVTRSIIHLMEEVNVNNTKAEMILGYKPKFHWKTAIDTQIKEMEAKQSVPMKMAKEII